MGERKREVEKVRKALTLLMGDILIPLLTKQGHTETENTNGTLSYPHRPASVQWRPARKLLDFIFLAALDSILDATYLHMMFSFTR